VSRAERGGLSASGASRHGASGTSELPTERRQHARAERGHSPSGGWGGNNLRAKPSQSQSLMKPACKQAGLIWVWLDYQEPSQIKSFMKPAFKEAGLI